MCNKKGNAWKGGKTRCNCKSCGKFVYKYSHRLNSNNTKYPNEVFCSRKCTNKKREAWNKGKIGYLAGEKHYNWNGGKSREKHNHRGKYYEWMMKVFERDEWTCQRCNAKSKKGKKVYLEAHHIKSWAKFKKLRFTVSNGITYCLDCHCIVDPYRARFIK